MIGEKFCKMHDWLEECIRFNEELADFNDNPLVVSRALNNSEIFNQLPEYISQRVRFGTDREAIEFALSTTLDQWKTDQIETLNMILEQKKEIGKFPFSDRDS
jgi:hypothetical protein